MSTTVTIEVDAVVAATDKAIKVEMSGSGRRAWIPRSVIVNEESDIQSDAEENETGALAVKKWFADQEGLEE